MTSSSDSGGGEPCAPGFRDDDWWLFLDPAPCSLLQPAKDTINALGLALTVLALLELGVSRYVRRVDKAPTTVTAAYTAMMLIMGGTLVYQLAQPRASAQRVPDFFILFITLYFKCTSTMLLSLAVARHLVLVAKHLLRTVIDRDTTKEWARWIGLLQTVAWGLVVLAVIINIPLMVVLPALHVGDQATQHFYMTAAYGVLAAFAAGFGVVLYVAVLLTERVIEKQVRVVFFGVNEAAAGPLDLRKARENGATAKLTDLLMRLRFNLLATFNNFGGLAVIWSFTAAYGMRWYLNHVASTLAIVSSSLICIALFRPALLPRFLGGSLGLIGPTLRSSVTNTGSSGNHKGSSHDAHSDALGGAPLSSSSIELMSYTPSERDRGSVGSIDIMKLDLSRGLDGVNEIA